MYISEVRKNKEIEGMLKQYFLDKKVPTIREVIDYIKYLDSQQDFDKPFASLGTYGLVKEEVSSVSKNNKIFYEIQKDLEVAYEAIMTNSSLADGVYGGSFSELQLLLSRLKKSESRIMAQLAMVGMSEGYFYVIDEPLGSLDKVDLTQTTAKIDIKTQTVTINEVIGENLVSSQYKPKISGSDAAIVKFGLVNKSGLISQSSINSSLPSWIFLNNGMSWLYKIITNNNNGIQGELRIDLKETVILSSLVFKKSFAGEQGVASISAMYSVDGTQYLSVPSSVEDYVLGESTNIVFTPTSLRYLKLIINKYYPDEVNGTSYTYYLGAKSLELYNSSYDSEDGNTFISLPQIPYDSNGLAQSITQVACDTCEVINDENTIDYYLSFDEGITYSPISPYGKSNPNHPTLIQPTALLEVEYPNLVIPEIGEESDNLNYSGKSSSFNLPVGYDYNLGTFLDVTSGINNTLTLYRNIGIPGKYENIYSTNNITDLNGTTPDYNTLAYCYQFEGKNIPKGWKFDGNYYSCIFSIGESTGRTIDFGTKSIWIDGIEKSGIVSLSYGDHSAKVKPENFSPLVPKVISTSIYSYTLSNITSIELEEGNYILTDASSTEFIDPLYPFNHRLLIEGLSYSLNYEGSRFYVGTKRYAAYKLEHISTSKFLQDTDKKDLQVFTATGESSYDGLPISTLLVKSADEEILNSLRRREEYNITLRTFDNTQFTAESVVFKAVLKSKNNSTPQLQGYRLKLGVLPNES